MEGYNRYPKDVATREAGRHYAEEFPRLEAGKYIGIASAPLKATNFEPDVVMIYCDSAQLGLLLLGREYQEGHNLKCFISGHAACVYGVVPAMQTGECQVAAPCRGTTDLVLDGALGSLGFLFSYFFSLPYVKII